MCVPMNIVKGLIEVVKTDDLSAAFELLAVGWKVGDDRRYA